VDSCARLWTSISILGLALRWFPCDQCSVDAGVSADASPLERAARRSLEEQWGADLRLAGCRFQREHSSTKFGHFGNAPVAYYLVPNSVQPDREVLYIERQPDTVQTDHFDWGFRLTTLYGLDYRFTTAKGYFSQQLLGPNSKEYGVDPVMAYVDLYFPQVADGMNVRIGRYISLPDIEAQLAPNNYTYSHSILYTFDAYTQMGINTTIRLNQHWMVQIGLSAGNDVAPWVGEPDAKPTLNSCVAYTWLDGRDNHYACLTRSIPASMPTTTCRASITRGTTNSAQVDHVSSSEDGAAWNAVEQARSRREARSARNVRNETSALHHTSEKASQHPTNFGDTK
jgi:Putative beta-barrel porin-2, OmpL-like. bbp2